MSYRLSFRNRDKIKIESNISASTLYNASIRKILLARYIPQHVHALRILPQLSNHTKAIYTIDDIALMYCYILSNRAQQLGLLDLA